MDGRRSEAVAVAVLAAVLATLPCEAGTGAAELSLDRAAVLGLLDAALPGPIPLGLAGTEPSLELDRASALTFRDGGVEATVRARLAGLGWAAPVRVRFVPEVGRLDGVVRLRAASAVPDVRLPVDVDLAALLPAVNLPRRFDLELEGPAGRDLAVVCVVHGVEVEQERLVVRLGLLTRSARAAPRAGGAAARVQGSP